MKAVNKRALGIVNEINKRRKIYSYKAEEPSQDMTPCRVCKKEFPEHDLGNGLCAKCWDSNCSYDWMIVRGMSKTDGVEYLNGGK